LNIQQISNRSRIPALKIGFFKSFLSRLKKMLDTFDKKLWDKFVKKNRKKIGKVDFNLSLQWELEKIKKRQRKSFRQRNIELKEIYRLRDKIEKEMRAAANAAQENTPAASQAPDDGNQVPIANILDSTVAPMDITEAYIEDTLK
jgi:hypothetical protein